jgi:hypothetical protein
MVTAFGRQVSDGDAEDLADLLAIARHVDQVTRDTITHMRTVQEITWATIGKAAGITRQSAQERWKARP